MTDTIYGQLRSRLTDPFTNETSVKFEAFSSFAVPIPIPTKLKLQCVFFPLKDGPLGARMIEVDVPRAMPSGEDMADAVSAITGVDKECLRVEEIYHGKVWQSYYNSKMKSKKAFATSTLDQDHFCVYEMPTCDEVLSISDVLDSDAEFISKDATVVVQLRWSISTSSYGTGSSVGNPLYLVVGAETTAADIYSKVDEYITNSLEHQNNKSADLNEDSVGAVTRASDVNQPPGESKTDSSSPERDYSIEIETSSLRELPNEDSVNFLEECAMCKMSRTGSYNSSDTSPKLVVGLSKVLAAKLEKLLCDPRKYDSYRPPQHESQRTGGDANKNDGRLTLQSCLEKFTTREQLGENDEWYSPFSKKHVRAFKEMAIWSLPDILVIQLKRFLYESSPFASRTGIASRREKVTSLVHFPIEGLNMKPFVSGPCEESEAIYDLYAVSNHMGGMGGGHYTAYALNSHNGKWYEFDDTRTQLVSAQDVVTPKAYVLFYCRRRVMEQQRKVREERLTEIEDDGDK